MSDVKRIEIVGADDPRFILLRIDRVLLILLVSVLAFMAAVHTFGIVQSIKDDDLIVRETRELRRELDTARKVIENANETSEASVEFWRCAFLIEPDVEKTEEVMDRCIEQAQFPNGGRR